MKEFWVYTLLRLLFFLAAFAVVFGIWFGISGDVPVVWVVVIAFVVSMPASYVLLNKQRAAFAAKVETRASQAAGKFEEMRAKEDQD